MEQQQEQPKENFFAISETNLRALAEYISRHPYNQVQPFMDLLTKLPRIQVNENQSTQD